MKKRYKAVGRCIYCNELGTSQSWLGAEHIVPRNIAGALILPKASCRDCERATTKFESELADTIFREIRAHLSIKGRRAKKTPTKIRVPRGNGTAVFPSAEYPLALHLFVLQPSELLGGPPPDHSVRKRIGLLTIFLCDDFDKRLKGVGTRLHVAPATPVSFAQLLAKIGHSYAVAELGLGAFDPYLPNLIRGPVDPSIYRFVGGRSSEINTKRILTGKATYLHELAIEFQPLADRIRVVTKIRLFPTFGGFTYYVAVGELLSPGAHRGQLSGSAATPQRISDRTPCHRWASRFTAPHR